MANTRQAGSNMGFFLVILSPILMHKVYRSWSHTTALTPESMKINSLQRRIQLDYGSFSFEENLKKKFIGHTKTVKPINHTTTVRGFLYY